MSPTTEIFVCVGYSALAVQTVLFLFLAWKER